MSIPTIESLGDQAVLLRWGNRAEIALNRRVHAVATTLRAASPPWLIDCVPAYASLAVFFDAGAVPDAEPMTAVIAFLSSFIEGQEGNPVGTQSRLVEIPVCYGGDFGPDLEDVAKACGISTEQVVTKHSQTEYLVAMLGFSPGFPYLLGLDRALTTPRLATPRLRVPAGSVGIGGSQTGIYPNDGPGGWRVIGRTPQSLFGAQLDPPTHLLPGDRLRFVPIDEPRFRSLQGGGP